MNKHVVIHRMSFAPLSINNGEGNVPKHTGDGQLYGSSQSTKRQIMEASGVNRSLDTLHNIAKRHEIATPFEAGEIREDVDGETDVQKVKGNKKSEGKHIIPWNDWLESRLTGAVDSGEVNDYNSLTKFVFDLLPKECPTSAKVFGHFCAAKGEKFIFRIDGAFGTTGHHGMTRGRGRTSEDFWTVNTNWQDNSDADSIGKKTIALDERYRSTYSFVFGDDDIYDDLFEMAVAAAIRVLIPRANKNNDNKMNVEYSVVVVGDDAGMNMPLDTGDGGKQYLDRLRKYNKGRGYKYIAYLPECDSPVSDESVIYVESEDELRESLTTTLNTND